MPWSPWSQLLGLRHTHTHTHWAHNRSNSFCPIRLDSGIKDGWLLRSRELLWYSFPLELHAGLIHTEECLRVCVCGEGGGGFLCVWMLDGIFVHSYLCVSARVLHVHWCLQKICIICYSLLNCLVLFVCITLLDNPYHYNPSLELSLIWTFYTPLTCVLKTSCVYFIGFTNAQN